MSEEQKQFINRTSNKLNYRILKVEDVVKNDETQEIEELLVRVLRADDNEEEPITEGTKLEATTLTGIVKSMIETYLANGDIPQTDAEKASQVANDLISMINNNVMDGTVLPSNNSYDAEVKWASNNEAVIKISEDNKVTIIRPTIDEGDVEVTLTVKVTVGASTAFGEVTILVTAVDPADQAKVEADYEAITLPAEVEESFELPSTGVHGSTLLWTVKNENLENIVIEIEGNMAKIVRQDNEGAATLTVNITYGTDTMGKQKEFYITVSPYYSPVAISADWIQTLGTAQIRRFYIKSLNNKQLYLEVMNAEVDAIDFSIKNNGTLTPYIVATDSTICGFSSPGVTRNFKSTIGVYKVTETGEKGNLVGEIPVTIEYQYPSSDPID